MALTVFFITFLSSTLLIEQRHFILFFHRVAHLLFLEVLFYFSSSSSLRFTSKIPPPPLHIARHLAQGYPVLETFSMHQLVIQVFLHHVGERDISIFAQSSFLCFLLYCTIFRIPEIISLLNLTICLPFPLFFPLSFLLFTSRPRRAPFPYVFWACGVSTSRRRSDFTWCAKWTSRFELLFLEVRLGGALLPSALRLSLDHSIQWWQ